MSNKVGSAVGSLGSAIGKGLIAGLAGTAAITISQMIEMKITKRKASSAPADAATKVLDVKAATLADKEKFSTEVHWAYGTSWGIARGLICLTGLKGIAASIVHYAAIHASAIVMETKLGIAPPISEWEPKTIAIDAMHHSVYAIAAGLVYDAIDYSDTDSLPSA